MACEARIIRVLRTIGYPALNDTSQKSPESFMDRPDQLARIVSWIEDRKVRGITIPERESLRTPGPAWEEAFFGYLRALDCPYLLNASGQQGEGESKDKVPLLLQGVSWLVSKAVACEFEDNAQAYKDAARQVVQERSSAGDASGSAHTAVASTAEIPPSPGLGCTPWSPEFLSALDAAFVGMGLDPPSISLPPPPINTRENPAPRGDERGRDADVRVLQALETLLAETNKGSGRGDTGSPRVGGGGLDALQGYAPGVSTGDEACDRVATVLRMLYLLDLRGVQDEINGILALAQTRDKA